MAVVGAAREAAAQVRVGSRLSFNGVADATDLGRPGVRLDFQGPATIATSGNTGSFASFNRSAGPAAVATINDFTVGRGPQQVPNLLTLGGYQFSLTSLPSGPFGQASCYVAPAAGQRCTPYQSELGRPVATDPLSPFYMTNVATGDPNAPLASVISFNLLGTVRDPRGISSWFFGTISTTLPFSFQEVLFGLEQAGGVGLPLPGVPFTGTFFAGLPIGGDDDDDRDDDDRDDDDDDDRRRGAFARNSMDLASLEHDALAQAGVAPAVTVTPEPGALLLVGAGLAATGLAARRRRRTTR